MKKSNKVLRRRRESFVRAPHKLLWLFALVGVLSLSCSLENKEYVNLSLSIEVPQALNGTARLQPNNSRFIHPDGTRLLFKLYARGALINEQTIPLNPQPTSLTPQNAVAITIEKVPYNQPLKVELFVYGENPQGGNEALLLGSNEIELGALNRGVSKVSLGVKPTTQATAKYELEDPNGEDENSLLLNSEGSSAIWKIQMYPKKGLYVLDGNSEQIPDIRFYDAEGKTYQNTFLLDTNSGFNKTLVFYHPENSSSTYYAYFGSIVEGLWFGGSKLSQSMVVTKLNVTSGGVDILFDTSSNPDAYAEDLGQVSSWEDKKELVLTMYNPYPFSLQLSYRIENGDGQVNEESKNKFTFTGFPDVLLPGKSKEFTVSFQDSKYIAGADASYSVKCTMSAPEVSDFVLLFTGSTSG